MFSFQANAYKDTLPNDVTNITYEPKLATFEMDIMQVKHTRCLPDDQKNLSTKFYTSYQRI